MEWEPVTEETPMEIEASATTTATTARKPTKKKGQDAIALPPKRILPIEEEFKAFSAVRPSIKGIPCIIEDRPLTAHKREKVGKLLEASTPSTTTTAEAKKREPRRGQGASNWSEMELFGNEDSAPAPTPQKSPISLAEEVAAIVLTRLKDEKTGTGAPTSIVSGRAERRSSALWPKTPQLEKCPRLGN